MVIGYERVGLIAEHTFRGGEGPKLKVVGPTISELQPFAHRGAGKVLSAKPYTIRAGPYLCNKVTSGGSVMDGTCSH